MLIKISNILDKITYIIHQLSNIIYKIPYFPNYIRYLIHYMRYLIQFTKKMIKTPLTSISYSEPVVIPVDILFAWKLRCCGSLSIIYIIDI